MHLCKHESMQDRHAEFLRIILASQGAHAEKFKKTYLSTEQLRGAYEEKRLTKAKFLAHPPIQLGGARLTYLYYNDGLYIGRYMRYGCKVINVM